MVIQNGYSCRCISYFTRRARAPIVGSLSGGSPVSGQILVQRDEYIATITIDNEAKRNAMTQAMWIAMGDAVLTLSNNSALRCIVLRGQGTHAFGRGPDSDESEKIQ